MRAEASPIDTMKARGGRRPVSRTAALRRARLRALALEKLEERQLLATLPAVTVTGSPLTLASSTQVNLSSPSIIADPLDPQKMISVFTVDDPAATATPVFIDAGYSTDGGKTWTDLQNIGSIGNNISDFTSTATPPPPFPDVTDATLAFDGHDNFYILSSAHEADNSAGQFTLEQYSFAGTTPTQTIFDEQVPYNDPIQGSGTLSWQGGSQFAFYSPGISADAGQATFTSTDSKGNPYTQTDPGASFSSGGQLFGGVYITLTQATTPATPFNGQVFILTSEDGGNTFTAVKLLSAGEVANSPVSTVSQGRPVDTAGHGKNDTGVSGGQITTVFDDSSSFATANPPLDRIVSDVVRYGSYTASTSPNTPIIPASGTPGNFSPAVTSIPLNINVPDLDFQLADITATVSLTYNNISELQVLLVPPAGSGLPSTILFNNRLNAKGVANPNVGATGTNIGLNGAGVGTGTVFTDLGGTSLYNNTGGAASISNFLAEGGGNGGGGTLLDSAYGGAFNNQVSGTWTLQITAFGAGGGAGAQLKNFALKITDYSGLTVSGENTIGTTAVLGQFNEGVFPNSGSTLVTPGTGFGPAPAIASDNTLGAFDPYEGRIYVAYVTHPLNPTPTTYPVDDTNITLMYSDDGGITWQGGNQINDNSGPTDGFSGGDRPMFQPSLAVDPTTGTLAASWYDARFDAARARVAMEMATSIDGGQTFSPNQFVNQAQTATDAITGNTITIGPVPDNQSAGNGGADKTFNFGSHQGLAFFGGTLYPIWTSNENGGSDGSIPTLGIVVGQATTAAGPRIVASTMGPVGNPGDTLNTTRSADGGPEATSFTVTFDRPVQASSFDNTNVSISFQSAYNTGAPVAIPQGSISVTPFIPAGDANNPFFNGHFGYTEFKVSFPAQTALDLAGNPSYVGAYTYSIQPNLGKAPGTDINSGINYVLDNLAVPPIPALVTQTGSLFDQNSNGIPLETADVYAIPNPNDEGDTLPLVVPGPSVVSTALVGAGVSPTNPNLMLNNAVTAINVTFDRAINAATFTPASILRMTGPAGVISGPFSITKISPTVFQVVFPTQSLSGTYTLALAPTITDTNGDQLDSNQNAGVYIVRGANPYVNATPNLYPSSDTPVPIAAGTPATPGVTSDVITVPDTFAVKGVTVKLDITYPHDPDLTAYLISPSGTRVQLFAQVGATGSEANFTGTVFDDTVNPPSPIAQGGPPFFGSYNPQQSLNTAFVSNAPNSKGTWTLEIDNIGSTTTGTLNSWSVTLLSRVPNSGLGEPVADQGSLGFRIWTDAPSNRLSSDTWTSVGPAPIINPNNGASLTGTASAIAVDPSDPSGNTVFVGGASGGVWKTTNFLTSNPAGPTWIPLTDFGPTSAINIGAIAIFPRGNDPTKSIILAGTGDATAGTKGYGFLRSTDGGATWQLLDSQNNNTPFASADHLFSKNNTYTYKIVADPTVDSTGQVIFYAALGGSAATAGIWKSADSGSTWQPMLINKGDATSVTLDPISGTGVLGGNLQIVYAAFPGSGVFSSPNQGVSWFPMLGTTGNPLIQDVNTGQADPVTPLGPAPTGAAGGLILLANPAATSVDVTAPNVQDQIYEGWLYALVVTGNNLDGLYMTKDFGQNWTKVHLASKTYATINPDPGNPSNDSTLADFDPFAGNAGGKFNVSFAIDPTNPNVVYIGGAGAGQKSGFMRVDTTGMYDPHAFVAQNNNQPDGGALEVNTTGPISLQNATLPALLYEPPVPPPAGVGVPSSFFNLIRDPDNVFAVNATLLSGNVSGFNNTGADAKWFPVANKSALMDFSSNQHALATIIDPLTGHARLILADDMGIFTGIDDAGSFNESAVGNAAAPLGTRNGNLALTQFYYGAIQPSAHDLNNNIRAVLTYGGATEVAGPTLTSSDYLGTASTGAEGNQTYSGGAGTVLGTATDPTGSGTVYQFVSPGQAGTNFFQVNGVGRTFNLTTGPTDPQWFGVQETFNNGQTPFGNFEVNPVNGNQIIISSNNGSVYRTENKGVTWFQIAASGTLDGDYAPAVAFGAPDPAAPGGIGNLDNFIYVGTLKGNIYATRTGGGSVGGNAWTLVGSTANGLDGSTVQRIVTDPTRGSHRAYAITLKGVYYNPDTLAAGAKWQNITGNLFSLTIPAYGNGAQATPQLTFLDSLQVDWRYVLPSNPTVVGSATHPLLYVSGDGGVYRSLDNGTTWKDFPTASLELDNSSAEGGYLPNTRVSDLSLSIGNVNTQTGRATVSTANGVNDPSVLIASTFGRGQFAIRLSPIIIPNTPNAPAPNDPHQWLTIDPATLYGTTVDNFQVTNVMNPIIDGYGEQSAFGNTIGVALYNLGKSNTLPTTITIGPGNLIGSGLTDGNGHFSIRTGATSFPTSGYYYVGIQGTDQAGGVGNLAIIKILVELPPVTPPTGIVLDPSSDSGRLNNDDYTWDNNSAQHPAPIFDVSGVLPGATAYIERNGVVVGSAINSGATIATIQVADTNGGNGVIPDSPVGSPPDTAPPAGNPYSYLAFQIDSNNLQSGPTSTALKVIIDSTAPAAPTSIKLDPASDSGTLNNDNYTWDNNSAQHPAPVFDVTGIEPNATVVLLRDGVIVNEVVAPPAGTLPPGGLVQIADTNGAYNGMPGNGPIPDSPVGNPPDTAPPAGHPYTYTTFQIDLAGNVSTKAGGFGNTGAVVLDGTDSDLHGNASPTANLLGWLYMQKVLTAIQPNVTDGQKILVALGPQFGVFGPGPGTAAMAITSAFKYSPLPGLGWTLEFVNGPANEDAYLSGSPANALDPTGAAAGTVTLAKTGLLYITTSDETFDDLNDPDLVVLNKHGADIKNYVVNGGGLYTQAETPSGAPAVQNNPPGYGWLTSLFPGIGYFSLGSGGTFPTNIQLTPQGQAVFPGLTSADLSSGPWHGYFTGTFSGGLVPMFTDTYQGNSVVLALASFGVASSNQIIIDSTAPVAPPITLDPGSDSGTFNNDQVTQDNNGNPYPAPLFDLTNVEPNAIVQLYRSPVVGGVVGAPVLVNTVTVPANAAIGPFSILDTNAGKGTIPDGTYQYTAKQTDLAGNIGPLDTPITVVIDATAPVAPTALKLDPASDTGTFNNDDVTKDNNSGIYPAPNFDVSSIEAHANVELFRAPIVNGVIGASVLVNTLVNVPAGGTLLIPDTNAGNGTIPDGTYQYSAKQVDLAGNISPLSNTVTVIISTSLPTPNPPPTPVLDPTTDTGTFNNDDITQDNNGNPYPAPLFDIGSAGNLIAATETVELFRAPIVNGVVGTPVLVNTLTNVKAGVVQILDINAGNGKIADGKYQYTDELISLSGVPGPMSKGLTVIINATPPAAPTPFRLDAASDTGVSNSDGITQVTLIHFPVFDVGGVVQGATVNLYRGGVVVATLTNTAGGTVNIQDANQIPDGSYTYTVGQVNLEGNSSPLGGPITVIYDTAQPATPSTPVLDPASQTGPPGSNTTSNLSPFLDVTVAVSGFELNSSLSLVRDGTVIAQTPYNVSSGVVSIQDPGPVSLGVHIYQAFLTDKAGNVSAVGGPLRVTFVVAAPGTLVLDPASDSGVKGDNITNVTNPTFDALSLPANETLKLLQNGVVVASVPTGVGGKVLITDPGPLTNGSYTFTSELVSGTGTTSPPGPPLVVTIDTTKPPAPTGLALDPASDSGVKGDNITNVTNPTFDVSSIVAGATVELLRNGVVIAMLTSPTGGNGVKITDAGPVANGKYTYTAEQISIAGNTSLISGSISVTIDTSTPATPTVSLDPASQSSPGANSTYQSSPTLDVSGVLAGALVALSRGGVVVATVTATTAGTVQITDPGPLTGGSSYTYTAVQTSAAGNVSTASAPLTISVLTSTLPNVPSLALATASDSGIKGDGVTAFRTLTFIGTTTPGATVKLYDQTGAVVGTGTASAFGNYSITLATKKNNGTYSYQAQAFNSQGAGSAKSMPPLVVKVVTIPGDYTDAGAASFALFRRTGLNVATWFVKNYPALTNYNFGAGGLDVPVAADFNGDGMDDPALYRPSTGQWYASLSTGYKGALIATFGGPKDVPVPDDYNGTGTAIEAVFRPATGQWFFDNTGVGGVGPAVFPINSIAAEGDYDGVNKVEAAVYNPVNSQWLVATPGASTTHVVATFGGPHDMPVPGQYDNITLAGQGKPEVAEAAVWRPSTGTYYIHGLNGTRIVQFAVGDIPVPGDYDGIGETEPAVYRPSTSQWLVEGPSDTSPRVLATFGGPADIPLLSPYPYRALSGTSPISGAGIGLGGSGNGGGTSFDFGGSSRGLSKGSSLNSSGVSSGGGGSLATAASTALRVAVPTRPNQGLSATNPGSTKGSLFDTAIGSLIAAKDLKRPSTR